MRLSKEATDALFSLAIKAGLKPTEFALRREWSWSGIYHEQSESHFLMKPTSSPMFAGVYNYETYNVNVKVMGGKEALYEGLKWDNAMAVAEDWVSRVNKQGAWADGGEAKDAFTAAEGDETGNASFTQEEQGQIAEQLQNIKEYLKQEFDLTEEQVTRIEEKLDEAAEASKRMGRKDWLVYFLGAITALIITATVAAPVGEHIFTIVIQGLAHLFSSGNEPPHIPPSIMT